MSAIQMAPISGKYKQAANIAMDVFVEHCAFLESEAWLLEYEPAASYCFLDVMCRSGKQEWDRHRDACPEAKVKHFAVFESALSEFLECKPAASHWFLDVMCRSGKQEWERLRDACPEAKVVVKSNDILVSLPPLPEELELTVFGKPGEFDMKRMQLCIFGRKPVIGKDWVISVYLCDDTVMAFENVYKREEKKGNKLLTTRAGLFVANSDEDIKISVNTLETGWQIKGSGTKTIKSRNAWNSPENVTDFPCLKFEVCHVDEMKQSFFCGITASHGTDIAEAEIRTFFKQENEKADSLNISDDFFKGCQELQANDNRTGHPKQNHRWLLGTILWLNVMLVLICFMPISKDFKPGSQAEEMKNMWFWTKMKMICPHREPVIKSGDYEELLGTVSDPVMKSDKKSHVHCDENLKCDICTLGIFEERIKFRSIEQGMLVEEQLIMDHLLTFACYIGSQADEMKDVCFWREMKMNRPHLEPAIKSGDYEELLWTVSDPVMKSDKKSHVHRDENLKCDICTLGIFEERIKFRSIEQGMLVVEQLIKDDLLTFACYIERNQNESTLVYHMNVPSSVNCLSTVAGQDVNLNQALTFGCHLERKQKKPPLVYQMNVSSSVNCSAEGGSKFCNDTMSCQWKGNTVYF